MLTHKPSMNSQLHAYVNPQADLRRKKSQSTKTQCQQSRRTDIYHRHWNSSLLHVDYWAYTTKRQLLQLDVQLVFGFNIAPLMPKPGLILKLFAKNISFRTVLIRKRKLAPSTSF